MATTVTYAHWRDNGGTIAIPDDAESKPKAGANSSLFWNPRIFYNHSSGTQRSAMFIAFGSIGNDVAIPIVWGPSTYSGSDGAAQQPSSSASRYIGFTVDCEGDIGAFGSTATNSLVAWVQANWAKYTRVEYKDFQRVPSNRMHFPVKTERSAQARKIEMRGVAYDVPKLGLRFKWGTYPPNFGRLGGTKQSTLYDWSTRHIQMVGTTPVEKFDEMRDATGATVCLANIADMMPAGSIIRRIHLGLDGMSHTNVGYSCAIAVSKIWIERIASISDSIELTDEERAAGERAMEIALREEAEKETATPATSTVVATPAVAATPAVVAQDESDEIDDAYGDSDDIDHDEHVSVTAPPVPAPAPYEPAQRRRIPSAPKKR